MHHESKEEEREENELRLLLARKDGEGLCLKIKTSFCRRKSVISETEKTARSGTRWAYRVFRGVIQMIYILGPILDYVGAIN